MSDAPTQDEILAAVKASGYLLEQEVANLFESLDYNVCTNYAFRDLDQDESRELDVRAFRREYFDPIRNESVWIEYLVECKNGTHPIAFLSRPKSKADYLLGSEELMFPCDRQPGAIPGDPGERLVPPLRHLGLDRKHYFWSSTIKCTQFCRIERSGGGWAASHGAIYNSLLVPLAKAVFARRYEIYPSGELVGHVWLFVPMVVTAAPLFLIDTAKTPAECKQVPHVTLLREFSHSKLKGRFAFDFVQRDALRAFVEEKVQPFVQEVVYTARNETGLLFRRTR